MKKLIIANWKMNMPDLKKWRNLRAPKNVEVVICPPFTEVSRVRGQVSRTIKIGGQDVFWEQKGPFTGEVSPAMLKKEGATYVIIGHSEHRKWLKETDQTVNKKVLAALKAGFKVILCVGEPLAVRRKGLRASESFVKNQIKKDLKGAPRSAMSKSLIVAYEPIWAISTSGTGRIDTPEDAVIMIEFIRELLVAKPYTLYPKVLYGGSVSSKNIKNFLQYKEINGALVGGASLKAEEFKKIIMFASRTTQTDAE